MYEWHDGSNLGGWLAMGLMMVVFWGFLAAFVVCLMRWGQRSDDRARTDARPEQSALHILSERFARGEIDADEYAHRRDLLRSA